MTDFKWFLTITITVLFIVGSIITIPYLMPSKKVKEYYVDSYYSSIIGSYPRIRIIIENGVDKTMELPEYTFSQAVALCDSLNNSLNEK